MKVRPSLATLWIPIVILASQVEAAKALTWNFTYEVTGSGTIRNGSWTDQAPENPLNIFYPITSVSFNTGQMGQNFNTDDGARFGAIPGEVSYVDGQIAQWQGQLLDPTFSYSFQFPTTATATIINEITLMIEEEGQNVVFTRASAGGVGADYELNVVPACLLIGVVFAIKKLLTLLRKNKSSCEATELDSREGASSTGK